MNFSVLGAGELGLACGLALRANGAGRVALFNRDGALRKAQKTLLTQSTTPASGSSGALLPEGVSLTSLAAAHARVGEPSSIAPSRGVFICSPVTSLLPTAPGEDTALPSLLRSAAGGADGSAAPPFVACLSRGLSADGETAVELVARASGGGATLPVLAVTGPVVPAEWARQSLRAVGPSPPADAPAPFSGTALTVAVAGVGGTAGESWLADAAFHDAMEALLTREVFARESVVYERDATAGAALALVNGCLPLCAFGAGLVSNAYTGAGVSALAAYGQHCAAATTELVNALVAGRAAGQPLPMGAYAAIFSACNVFSGKEFILGRQFDFQFRQADAVRSVYARGGEDAFAATVDGLHTRMQAGGVASPFFEVLMDTFGTVLRASTVGQGLVQQGHYGYREAAPSPLLEHVMAVDEAMLSGDEERFAEAKRRLEEAFTMYPVRKDLPS